MSEFGRLWKRQNNPACTKKYVSLHNVEVGHSTKEEKEGVTGCWSAEFTGRKRLQTVLLRQNQFL